MSDLCALCESRFKLLYFCRLWQCFTLLEAVVMLWSFVDCCVLASCATWYKIDLGGGEADVRFIVADTVRAEEVASGIEIMFLSTVVGLETVSDCVIHVRRHGCSCLDASTSGEEKEKTLAGVLSNTT